MCFICLYRYINQTKTTGITTTHILPAEDQPILLAYKELTTVVAKIKNRDQIKNDCLYL